MILQIAVGLVLGFWLLVASAVVVLAILSRLFPDVEAERSSRW